MSAFYELRSKVLFEVFEKYPDLPTRTIARLLHKQYPELFPSLEIARNSVNYYRGTHGDKHRKILSNKKYVKI